MNEFTKEELKAILWYAITPLSFPPNNTLVPKLQDMIANYCEHQEMQTNSEVDYITTCASCDKVLKHE